MFSHLRTIQIRQRRLKHRRQVLRFDTLEDRRVLAGLEVFVFDDVDASRGFGSRSDLPLFDRPVFVDINRDGRFDQSEPWTTTDIDGIARFRNLEPGEYTIRLLGENNRVLQSSPAAPSATGVWHDEIGTVVRVESDGSAWTFSGNQLVKLNRELNTPEREFTFEGEIESVVLEDTSNSVSRAYVIANNAAGQKKLWTIPDVQADAVQLTSAQLGTTSQIVSLGAEILIRNGNSLHRVTTDSVGQIASSGQIGGATLDASSVLKRAGTSGFAVLNSVGSTSELSIYEISGTSAFVVGRRSFASEVKAWQPAPDGSSVAVSTADDFLIVEKKVGLPTAAILKDAVEPIFFDSGRSLLLTGNKTNSSELIGWQTSEWKQSLSIPITNGELTGRDSTLNMDRFGRFLIGNRLGRVYSHDLAEAVLVTAVVSANGTSQVQIGIRLLGQNSAPSLGEPALLSLNEDDAIQWSNSMLGSVSSDMDSDRLIYLVRSQPSLGSVTWNVDGSASYIPTANANGTDSFTVQAYDGWAWSEERSITVNVFAVDDAPSDLVVSTNEFEENVGLQSVLASVRVLDPDSDVDYQFQIPDNRFEIVDGLLKLISGVLNFENESTIVLPILAVNRLRPTETLSRTLTFSVKDRNDAPASLSVPSRLTIPELNEGFSIGQVQVVDEDADAAYDWQVSDPRFAVDQGQLVLRPGMVLDYETEPSISLTLRASDPTSSFFIERSINLSVTDQDDLPTGIRLTGSGSISENQPNAVVGSVAVLDTDRNERYSFELSDDRFYVNRGVIMLRPGSVLSRTDGGQLDLTIIATSDLTGMQIRTSSRLSILRDRTPYHNDIDPYDVDGDGRISPLDPLIIINHINNRGTGPIPMIGEGEEGPDPGIDVDGDGNISPIDILILINRINQDNEEESEGDDESDEKDSDGSDGMPEGEGEFVAGAKSLEIMNRTSSQDTLAPLIQSPVSPTANQAVDISLAEYLDGLDREVGPKRFRRR
jgi:hypothetical protein